MAGRPRQFDEDAALDQAMKVFWCRGYESAGLRELLDAMGISRQSCYNVFGDKHQLFLRTLNRYGDTVIGPFCQRLCESKSPLDAIRQQLEKQSRNACKKGQRGCLILNSIVEFGDIDESVTRLLRHQLERLENAYEKTLQRAQEQGELSPKADPKSLARYLIHVSLGFSALGKIKMSKESSADVVSLALKTIEAVS